MFDFEENGTVSDIGSVPEKYQGLYAETKGDDGNTVYTISDPVKALVADYIGTSKNLAATRNDKKKASDESAARRRDLKEVESLLETYGIDLDEEAGLVGSLSGFIKDLQAKVEKGEDVNVNLEKIKADFNKRAEEQKASLEAEIKKRDAALSKHLISDQATRALMTANAKSVQLLQPHVESRCKVVPNESGDGYEVRVLDSQGDFRYSSAGGWMTVEDLVNEMKQDSTYAPAFASESPSGTGTVPGSMRTPPPRNSGEDRTPNQKIKAGLAARQR